ncbi:hypothetical protein FRC12_020442 [Ceratobasidium sp. 428]|nr:hypothetical protein FRC12_020442 [Ceratobasidium sp. 428]
MVLEIKPRRPKLNIVQNIVVGALPTLAHLLHVPTEDSSWVVISPSHDQDSREHDSLEWTSITPVAVAPTRDFPMLPAADLTRSSARLLGSLMSAFKSIPDLETWPMTSNSIGLSSQQITSNTTFRVRAQDLSYMWSALPGSGGIVRSLQWRRDTGSVSHESVVLRVSGVLPLGHEEDWWICLERFPEGDLATLSRDRSRVERPGSAVRAEMHFTDGLSFGHVLRILEIIHDVSRHYFLIGANCWFYASVIVEMLNIHIENKKASVKWIEGKGLNYCDHHTTKELNHKQYHEINSRVRQMSKPSAQRPKPGSWISIL